SGRPGTKSSKDGTSQVSDRNDDLTDEDTCDCHHQHDERGGDPDPATSRTWSRSRADGPVRLDHHSISI
ncbi:hypothetical protein, partial [Microbacterium lacticum]|uniref:hypothetical protein n=1 Tax=Microbacterium lacticum TaxID=33885 RepID=UPI001E4AD38C